jgi:hypothetical protein
MSLQEIREYPYAQAIIGLFKSLCKQDSMRVYEGTSEVAVMANIHNEFGFSMELRRLLHSLRLNFYNCPVERIPAPGWSNVFVSRLAEISGEISSEGHWSARSGYLKKEVLWVRLEPIALPSKASRWLLETLSNFAKEVGEFYPPLSEKEPFWGRSEY